MKKDSQIVQCHYCDFMTNDAAKYLSHIGDMHSPKFSCETCGEEFSEIQKKIEHVMVTHAFNYTTQQATSETVECFDCGEKLGNKHGLMSHKKAKHFKTKLCSYFQGHTTTCRFPNNKCMNIHNENIQPTAAESDYRSRIICKNGSECFFRSQPEGCFYKHVDVVQQQPNAWQQRNNTRENTRALSGPALPVESILQPVVQSTSTHNLDTNQLVMNLCKQMESISQKLQFLELKSMTDFPSIAVGQGRR